MRVAHAVQVVERERVVEREHRARGASTGANVDAGRPPGRCVGESGVTSSGCCALELAQLAHERVELGVAELGIVVDEVPLGVVLDQLAQRSLRARRASAGAACATIRD